MTDTLEHMEALDQKMQAILPLLTQAVQATQEAEALIEQIPGNTAPSLVAALPNLRTALHVAVDNHNTLIAEIAAAKAAIQATPSSTSRTRSDRESANGSSACVRLDLRPKTHLLGPALG